MQIHTSLVFGVAMLIGGGFCEGRVPRDLAQEERNKAFVIWFEQTFAAQQDFSIFDKYVALDIIQHSSVIADGREGFKEFALRNQAPQPYKFYIERAVAEGDLVWLHLYDPATGNAVVTIWRVRANLLVEHWDVVQSVDVTSANPHPFFNAFAADFKQQCQYVRIQQTIN